MLLIALSNTKLCNQNDEFTVKTKDRHRERDTEMLLRSLCVGETQRLIEKGLMEEGKETKSFYRGRNVGVKWRPEF